MDVVAAAKAAHAKGLAVRLSQLVFDNVDDDMSGTITDDEFGALLSSLNIQVMDDISDMLSRISATLTAESLHELVVSKARIDSIAKPNLGMLCRPLPRVGALRVNGETLDSILGRRCLTVQAIELCGMPPEGALSVSERCRLYSALWISIARGSWGMARGKVERNLRIFVAAAQERTLAIAWSRLPAGSRLALDMAAEREAVGSRLVHGASDEDVDSLRHGGWFTSMAGLVHEEDRRGLAGSLGVAVTFALFADAMEALVHKHEDKHTPGGTILWRLYCVARVLEGFPAGPPFAASARSGFRTSRPFSEVESTTALDASLHQLRQAREAAEEAQLACGLGSSAVPSTDDAHSIRKDMQSGRGTDLSRAGLRSLWEALPRFERLRSTEVSPLSGEAVPRHVLSFGECFVLAPFEDEEDVATLPLVQLAAQVAGMARPARPRRLPFAAALRVAMLDDPCGDAALARTLGWDPAQPFSPAARWKAFGSILESPPGEPPAHVKWPNPGRASGAGARGRMSVMRWCLESSCLVPGALGQGRRVAAASGLIRSGLDPVVYGFDVWATILARATFEKVLGHLAAAVARGLRPPSRSSPLGAEAAARVDPGRDSTAARVAAATRWAQELVELASGLGGVPAAAWDVDARSRLNERDVADWAAGLFGLRGRVGWDGLLAAALWNRSEAPLPRNAGALVDMEPHAGDPRGACDETSCATPARTMALLTVLSQLRPAADGSFTPRGWALAAKAAYSRAWELFQAMTHAIRSKPSATENDAMWASALARALWEARREAPAARLDVTSFLATAAAAVEGGDTQPGHPGVVALLARTLHLSGGTLRDAIAVMRDVAGP
ncbi:hypothetical protein FNF27_06282 [Cafeteria roenbergensis]|uniref:EF-hand domain-containing protein n=1 Tax=Cafeteria roenbergensis TaxID=33653 RepID=A0A5A8E1F1_CAFRO|nr:hypothetical protein FNF27_06282 [Cafeteria roenbergensis]